MGEHKEEIIKSLKRWMTQTAREFRCKDEDIADVVYDYIIEAVPTGKF